MQPRFELATAFSVIACVHAELCGDTESRAHLPTLTTTAFIEEYVVSFLECLPAVTYSMYQSTICHVPRVLLSNRASITYIKKKKEKKGTNQPHTSMSANQTNADGFCLLQCHSELIEASSGAWKTRHCGSLHRIKQDSRAFGFQTQRSSEFGNQWRKSGQQHLLVV